MWKNTGRERPDFAIEPGPGQESVWDYPRPPSLSTTPDRVEVRRGKTLLAASDGCTWVRETASPPTIYVPRVCVNREHFVEAPGRSFCEWKGTARYWALASDPKTAVAWAYPEPSRAFARIADQLSFYPGRVACYLNGERVRAQAGGFYGGWITDAIVGPFKGDAGTGHW